MAFCLLVLRLALKYPIIGNDGPLVQVIELDGCN